MFNAYVTTNDGGHLTPDSRVYVTTASGMAEAPVPERSAFAGGAFWPRVNEALHSFGYRVAWGEIGADDLGLVRFNATTKES